MKRSEHYDSPPNTARSGSDEPPPETMTAWLEREAANHHVQLAATAVVSGITVAGLIYGAQAARRKLAVDDLKASIPELNESYHAQKLTDFGSASPIGIPNKEEERAAALARRAQEGDYDEDLIAEQLTRTSSFLTPPRFAKLRTSFVIIIGLGGVGSHCTSALARSGVSHIRLVDFDQVTLSSLNRHAVATLTDVGTPKVECVRKRLEAVVPWVQWECFNEVWKEEQGERLLCPWKKGNGRKPDYVVDAIDNIDSKVALLKYCYRHGIKVVSSMGAGCKGDPTRVFVGDISSSLEDPLSRATRRRLRAAGINEGIPVAYSTEKPGPGKAQLLPLPDEEFIKGQVNELSVLPDFRARILPVLGTMPAVFGCTVANFIVMEITDYPHEIGGGKNRDKMYEAILNTLQGQEEKLARSAGADVNGLKIPVSKDDVGYLVEEVYRGKSAISGVPTRLTLARWRASERGYMPDEDWEGQKHVKLDLSELVCMTKEEAAVHQREVLLGGRAHEGLYSTDVISLVQRRQEEEVYYILADDRATTSLGLLGASDTAIAFLLSFVYIIMASSYGRGDFAAGLSSPSSSASFDSDNDTDLDSIEAEIQSHGYHLPFLDQQSLQQPPHQYAPPERYSSLRPDIEYDYGDVRPHPSQQYQLSGEDKQYFDQFWTEFHDKRRQRRAQAPGTPIYTERSVDDIMNGRHYQDKRYDARAYEFPRHRQPLVNLTRNGRHSDSRVKFHSAWSYDDSNPSSPTLSQVLSAPRPRRWLVILVTSIIFLTVYWRQYGAEAWHEHKTLSTAIQDKMQSNLGYFGTNMLPEFVGMTHLKTLDEALVPRSGDRKRLIIVGDVHGCVDELQALLSKLKFKLGSDHLIFAGDLISRGPSSSETIDLAMASQASCVRGNHEDRVLLAYRDMQIHHSLPPHPIKVSEGTEAVYPPERGPNAKPAENKHGESFLSGDHVEQALARSLSNEHVQYLASCPVILDIGPIQGLGEVRVVHAGLVPGVALRRQDPVSVMHMLTLDLETHVPSHVNDGTAWSKVWNKYQTFLPKKERSTVVYGHDSRRGLQLGKYTKGLDTGCVKGGKLTALILTSGNNKKPKTISVDCKDHRPKRAPSGEELGQS